MEEKYKKFLEYNWVESEQWQSYYRNLYPTPPPSKILRYKKKFYRNKIDPDFDIDYNPPNSTDSQSNYTNTNSNTNNTNSQNNENKSYNSYGSKIDSSMNYLSHYIEIVLMTLFLCSLIIRFKPSLAGLVAFLFRSLRVVKQKPELSIAYLHHLIITDPFQTFIFLFESLIDKFHYYTMIPVAISAIIAISENAQIIKINFGPLNYFFDYININKEMIYQDKSNIQVGIGFFAIIGWFFGLHSFMIIFAYWQLIHMMYKFNNHIAKSFNDLNNVVNQIKNREECPEVVKTIITKIQEGFYFCAKIGSPTEDGQARCNVC